MTKYEIKTDRLQWILYEKKTTGEDSKNPGETYLEPLGYYGSLNSLVEALMDQELRDEWDEANGVLDNVRDIMLDFVKGL